MVHSAELKLGALRTVSHTRKKYNTQMYTHKPAHTHTRTHTTHTHTHTRAQTHARKRAGTTTIVMVKKDVESKAYRNSVETLNEFSEANELPKV